MLLAGGLGLAVWLVTVAIGSVRGRREEGRAAAPGGRARAEDHLPRGLHPRADGRAHQARSTRSPGAPQDHSAALVERVPRGDRAARTIPGKFARDGKRRQLEGFLFPATYEFEPTTTSRQLVNRQLESFQTNWAKVDLAYAKSRNLTPYDVLIIASMIEKEVIAPEERALVSAVIYNRLQGAECRSGIDATIRYGLERAADGVAHEVAAGELDIPYNTRNGTPGLPPTPIANPGLASMQAAAHPAKVDYLFFVRKPDKVHHFFTASEREFNELHERARLRMISGTTRLVGLLGHPVSDSLSPRMQNAAFAARGLDWAYVPCDVAPDGLRDRGARPRRARLRRRERDDAAQDRRRGARRDGSPVREHARLRGRPDPSATRRTQPCSPACPPSGRRAR